MCGPPRGATRGARCAELRDEATPLVPVLRPAMQQDDRLTIRGPGLGDVHPQSAGIDKPVADAFDKRQLHKRRMPEAESRKPTAIPLTHESMNAPAALE